MDVLTLIRSLKKSVDVRVKKDKDVGKEISVPLTGYYNMDLRLKDQFYGFYYVLHAHRGRFTKHFSIHIRFKYGNCYHLLRLCLHGKPHRNTYKKEASGDHLHIYQFINGKINYDAIDLKKHKCIFKATDNLADALDKFLIVTNVEGRSSLC